MRGRKKEPEGKRVTICAKVSEPTAALIDKARGVQTRSAWLQTLIADALSGPAPAALFPIVVDEDMPPGTLRMGPLTITGIAPDEPAPKPRNCRHPKVRVKGVCPDCQTYVASK